MEHTIRPSDAREACRRADRACGRARRRRGGFTLLELIAVMAVVGVVSAIAIPRFGGAVNNYTLDSAARRVMNDLAIAQSQAKCASKPQTVTFTTLTSKYQLVGMNSPDLRTGAYVVDLSDAPYQTTIAAASFGASASASVTFDIYGIPDNGGTIWLMRGTSTRSVTLDAATGKATTP